MRRGTTRAPRAKTLLDYRGSGLELSREARSPHFVGPRQACHPDLLEICYIERGHETLARDRTHDEVVTGGHYVIVPPGRVHSSWTTHQTVREIIVHVPATDIERAADELGVSANLSWRLAPTPIDESLRSVLADLVTAAATTPTDPLSTSSLAARLLALLLRNHGGDARRPCYASARRLRVVEERLRSALCDTPSLDDLAKLAGLSRYHFLRAFKQRYGRPPHAYLTALRVEKAAMQLGTSRSMTDIAMDLGFSSSSRMSELFRRRYGLTPTAYRWQVRGGSGPQYLDRPVGRESGNQPS